MRYQIDSQVRSFSKFRDVQMGDLFRGCSIAAQKYSGRQRTPSHPQLGLHHICQSSPGGGDQTCALHTAGSNSLEREPHHYHMVPPQAQYSPPTLNTGNHRTLHPFHHCSSSKYSAAKGYHNHTTTILVTSYQ